MANSLLGMHAADWIVLSCYFIVILGIGVWSATRVKDAADFFMGGRRFGKFFMMFFAFGSGTSSDQAITVVAGTWRPVWPVSGGSFYGCPRLRSTGSSHQFCDAFGR